MGLNLLMLMIDYRQGSLDLATLPELKPLTPPCPCLGKQLKCSNCYGTGRQVYDLPFGDVLFIGKGPTTPLLVAMEVKEYSEFLTSLESGRLQTQLQGMAERYQVRYLILYGQVRPHPRPNTDGTHTIQIYDESQRKWQDSYSYHSYTALQRFLVSPSLNNLFIVRVVDQKSQLGSLIHAIYSTWTKPWESHTSLRTIQADDINDMAKSAYQGRVSDPDNSLGLSVEPIGIVFKRVMLAAQILPGIKYEWAKACAQRFKSPLELFSASIEDWSTLTLNSGSGGRKRSLRFGVEKAKRVWNWIREARSEKENG